MAPAFGSRHSPLALAGPHEPLAATVPLFSLGSHLLISHVPVARASKLKPWMWNVQTCGSFSMTDRSSPAPSWILTVPLLPPGSALAGPAERSRSATAATNVRIPVGLRIGVASSLRWGLVPGYRPTRTSTVLSTDSARGQRSLVDTCAIAKMLALTDRCAARGVRVPVVSEGRPRRLPSRPWVRPRSPGQRRARPLLGYPER